MLKRHWGFLGVGMLVMASAPALWACGPLTFEERVRAQEAMERVYYNHRIWPKENPTPKPPFEQLVPRVEIEAAVADALQKSMALELVGQRPIDAVQLQAEIDRMVKSTQDPATLSELFAALENDPVLVGECLARPLLANRLLRSAYAHDQRIHGELRAEVEKAGTRLTEENFASESVGEYSRRTFHLQADGEEPVGPAPGFSNSRTIALSGEAWASLRRQYGLSGERARGDALRGGMVNGRLNLSTAPSPFAIRTQEMADAFLLTRVVEASETSMTIEERRFPKRPLEEWLREQNLDIQAFRALSPEALRDLTRISPLTIACREGWEVTPALAGPLKSRYRHTAVWTGSEMILWGGGWDDLPSRYCENTGGRYNPATDTWMATSTGANCPSGRQLHTAVWTGTEMIVWGGNPGDETGGRYNPLTDSWMATSTGANCPYGSYGKTAVWTGTEMIVWGFTSGARYNPSTDTWMTVSSGANCPSFRDNHTAVWTGTEMIVWGGEHSDSLNSGGRYNPSTDTWRTTSTTGNCPSIREGHSAVWTGSEMIVWGGYWYDYGTHHYVITGGRYTPSTDSWVATSTGLSCPSGREGHTAVWTGSEMIIWGGGGWGSYSLNSGGRYNPSTNTWTATSSTGGCPSPSYAPAAVWTGTEMIVWGGVDYSTYGTQVYSNAGGRYNPSTNSWAATSATSDCPSRRYEHTAVWTGAEMIIWGGYPYASAGGLYRPSTDSWLATSTTGAPGNRYDHTAVWTGTEMLIWGGYPYTNSGGRYNPQADSWRAIAGRLGTPSARCYHAAVWTGTRMVVWGGEDAGAYLNTGGQYNPSADSWVATSTGANCPVGRALFTTVWTGTEMIVWGGEQYDGTYHFENTGGRYNPATNSWLPTSMGADCPSRRCRHTAVWTGSEMIVWGGFGFSDYYGYDNHLFSGGRYTPSTDAWVATPAGVDCPGERSDHTAVWTGTEMIVWGGHPNTEVGGRFNPSTDSWVAIAPTGDDPSILWGRTAVWTGAEMIVWGGYRYNYGGKSEDRYADCGGIYTIPVTVAVQAPAPFCEGSSATLVATAGFLTYQWIRDEVEVPGAASQNFTVTVGGNYMVRVTDSQGCVRTSPPQTVTVYPAPAPVVSGSSAGCVSVFLETTPFATYQWSREGVDIPGATAQAFTASSSGSYSVRVTDAHGCSGTSPAQAVAVNPLPVPTVEGPTTGCSNPGLVLTTQPSATYLWHRDGMPVQGAMGQTYTVTDSGSYTVRVTDSNGCTGYSAPKVVTVATLTPSISGVSQACEWPPPTLSTGSYSAYQWRHAPSGTYDALMLKGTSSGSGNAYYYDVLASPAYTIQSGDVLEYWIRFTGASPQALGGVDLVGSGWTLRGSGAVDQNGLSAHPSANLAPLASERWYKRSIAIPASGMGISLTGLGNGIFLALEGDIAGNYCVYVSDVKITRGGVTQFVSYDGVGGLILPSDSGYSFGKGYTGVSDGISAGGADVAAGVGQVLTASWSGSYAVFVTDAAGCVGISAYHPVAYLTGPGNSLRGVRIGSSTAQLTWSACDGATGYLVKRNENPAGNPSGFTTVATLATNAYLDAGTILPGQVWWYSITSTNGSCQMP